RQRSSCKSETQFALIRGIMKGNFERQHATEFSAAALPCLAVERRSEAVEPIHQPTDLISKAALNMKPDPISWRACLRFLPDRVLAPCQVHPFCREHSGKDLAEIA